MIKKELRSNGTLRVCTINDDVDMAQQQYKDSCDVNKIMEKYEKTGQITHLAKTQGRYANLGEPQDLMEAIIIKERADKAFETLPAKIKAMANHDPVQFIKMLQDPQYDDVLQEYGVKDKPKKSSPTNGASDSQNPPVDNKKS